MAIKLQKPLPRISATKPASQGTMAMRIVLNPGRRPNEWVTHLQTLPDRGKHYGHYFEEYEHAYDDYLKRCIKLGVEPRDANAELKEHPMKNEVI